MHIIDPWFLFFFSSFPCIWKTNQCLPFLVMICCVLASLLFRNKHFLFQFWPRRRLYFWNIICSLFSCWRVIPETLYKIINEVLHRCHRPTWLLDTIAPVLRVYTVIKKRFNSNINFAPFLLCFGYRFSVVSVLSLFFLKNSALLEKKCTALHNACNRWCSLTFCFMILI